jgi:hypothetical protein
MANKIRNKRKSILIVIGVIIGVLLTISIFISLRLEKIVVSELVKLTEEKSDGLYKLQIKSASFNLLSGKVIIRKASLAPDSAILNNRYLENTAPATIVNVEIGALHIKLSHWLSSLKNKNFVVAHFNIFSPHIRIVQDTALLHLQKADSTNIAINKPLEKLFSSLNFNDISIKNGFLEKKLSHAPDNAGLIVNGINTSIRELTWDSVFLFQDLIIPQWSRINFSIRNISYTLPGEHLRLEMNRLSFADSSFSWDSLLLIPLHDKFEYAGKTPRQTDWMFIQTKYVNLSGIDLKQLFKSDLLQIDEIFIREFYFASFKNRKIPPLIPHEKPLFHRLIHKIPFEINVPNIIIQDGKAQYEELALHAQSPGIIHFDDINLCFNGLTNRPVERDQFVEIDGGAMLMGKGKISVHFELPLDPSNQIFKVTGSLGAIDLRSVNPMIKPMANLAIERGNVDKVSFAITGTDHTASIDHLFLYHNLKINLLNKERNKTRLASKVVNEYVLKQNNPELKGKQRRVKTSVTRDIYRSNFQFWWSAIFEGTKETVGFTKEMQQEVELLKSLNEKIKNGFGGKKSNKKS